MNKKVLILSLLLLASAVSLFAIDSKKESSFYLYLNRKGVDRVWFSEGNDAQSSRKDSYVFPLVTSDSQMTLTSSIYVLWEHSASESVKLRLSFVSGEGEDAVKESGFMLKSTGETPVSLNYNVSVSFLSSLSKSKKTITGADTSPSATSNRQLTALDKEKRCIEIGEGSGESLTDYGTWAKIDMTVIAPYYSETKSQAWVEAQYYGYIKAEIIVK